MRCSIAADSESSTIFLVQEARAFYDVINADSEAQQSEHE
jgi:hypothetical protein